MSTNTWSGPAHKKNWLTVLCDSGLRTTCQFSSKIFYQDGGKTPHLWSTDQLNNVRFGEGNYNFYADNCSLELSEDGTSYTIKSSTNKQSIVNLKFTRTAPGFVMGKDGTSHFGTDPAKPWGSMRHAFWPRCKVEGSVLTQKGEIDFGGRGMFVHALQGMKPHHAGTPDLHPPHARLPWPRGRTY